MARTNPQNKGGERGRNPGQKVLNRSQALTGRIQAPMATVQLGPMSNQHLKPMSEQAVNSPNFLNVFSVFSQIPWDLLHTFEGPYPAIHSI